MKFQHTPSCIAKYGCLFLVLLGLGMTYFASGVVSGLSEPMSGENLPTNGGEDFDNATRLTAGEFWQNYILDVGSNAEYWRIYLNYQRKPLIYLNSSLSDYLDNFTVNVYNDQRESVFIGSQEAENPKYSIIYYFETTYTGNYYIVVSYTVDVKGDYSIGVITWDWGDSLDRPRTTAPNLILTDKFTYDWATEIRYWRIELNETQRCWLLFQELTNDVLEGTMVRVFRTQTNPIAQETENGSGTIELTFRALGRGTYYIEVIHSSLLDRAGGYQIYANVTEDGYSFETALELWPGSSYRETLRFGDPFFFRLELHENTQVTLVVWEGTVGGLSGAHVEIYDPLRPFPLEIFYEDEQPFPGIIRAVFNTTTTGTHYIVISPSKTFESNILIEIEKIEALPAPAGVVWKTGDLLLFIVSFLILPSILGIAYGLGFGTLREGWEATSPLKTCFEYFAVNESCKRIATTPYSSIDLVYIGGRSPIAANLRFTELTPARTRIMFARRRISWDILFGVALAFLFYFVISLSSWVVFGDDLTPFEGSLELYSLLLLLFLGPLVIFLLLEGNQLSSYRQFKSEIADGVTQLSEEFSYSSVLRERDIPKHVDSNVRKKIHLARRAWNHAKRDLREGRKESFIIKADTAIQFTLEARVLQTSVYDPNNVPSEFMKMAENLRGKGFDIPARRDIEWFRNVRNRIVHSAGNIDDRATERAIDHYERFMARLGLKS